MEIMGLMFNWAAGVRRFLGRTKQQLLMESPSATSRRCRTAARTDSVSSSIRSEAGGTSTQEGTLRTGGETLAYQYNPGIHHHTSQISPGVMVILGLNSDMTGKKARAVERYCIEAGCEFTCYDHRGHGRSTGRFQDGRVGLWYRDAAAVLQHIPSEAPQVLVGISMGAWLSLELSRSHSKQLQGLVLVGSAVDFTSRLEVEMDDPANAPRWQDGVYRRPSLYSKEPYEFSRALVTEARQHCLMTSPLAVQCPVRLLHGTDDPDVPAEEATKLLNHMECPDADLTLIQGGDHRLSKPSDLRYMISRISELRGTSLPAKALPQSSPR